MADLSLLLKKVKNHLKYGIRTKSLIHLQSKKKLKKTLKTLKLGDVKTIKLPLS